ncbi:hypothetical protein B7P43_G09494, partial [Cryptotermes secundus]
KFTRLQQQYGEECLSRTHVFECCKCFREGRERMENELHDRWPQTSVTKPNIDRADALICENRRITIKELGAMLSISVGSVEDIMKYHLHYRKVNARWVPLTLTDVNKMVRMQVASRLLRQFEDEGEAFLKYIVTTNETWVHYFIPESRQSSREWRHTSSPKPKSAEKLFGRKSDGSVLLGLAGGYPCRLSDRCQNSQCSVLLRPPGNRREGKDLIQVEERWKVGSLLSAPSDFYLFGRLKSDLQGMRFVDDTIIQNVREWICRQPQDFFEKGIRMLPEHRKKCVDSGGEYVED